MPPVRLPCCLCVLPHRSVVETELIELQLAARRAAQGDVLSGAAVQGAALVAALVAVAQAEVAAATKERQLVAGSAHLLWEQIVGLNSGPRCHRRGWDCALTVS